MISTNVSLSYHAFISFHSSFAHGTLNEVEGSVRLTSSLKQVVLVKKKKEFQYDKQLT
jgi:hypothetical protein